METYDITIIGAGPVGLYAAYYAGMRGLSVNIIENFDEAGGQPLNIYPEKHIFDVAGLPKTNGAQLTENLLKQLAQVEYTLTTGSRVEKIEKLEKDHFLIRTDKESCQSKSVLLATGHGLLDPRKIGVSGEVDSYKAGKLAYFVKNIEDYRDQTVAVLGGGDSALDWALMLEEVAKEVHLVHRRRAFRAAEMTTELVNNSTIKVHVPYTVSEMTIDNLLLQKVKEDEQLTLTVDKILVSYGFVTEDTDIAPGVELNRNHRVIVSTTMASNIAGLYAAGDACEYEGKVPLIAVGFGEGIIAVNDITKTIVFDHKLRNGHSSSIFQ